MRSGAALLVALWVVVAVAEARPRVTRVEGRLSSVSEGAMVVQMADGRLRRIRLGIATMYLRDDSPISWQYLQAGDCVMVRTVRRAKQVDAAEVVVGGCDVGFRGSPRTR